MLTASQLASLKTDISGQSSLAAAVAARDWPTVAAFYNAPSSPVAAVWRADITAVEILDAINGAELVALTPQKIALLQLLITPGTVDATSANIRADFSAMFAAGSASLTALTNVAQRTATRLEALFTTAQVSEVYGYALTENDVIAAQFGRTE